jgi:hypothetical protein
MVAFCEKKQTNFEMDRGDEFAAEFIGRTEVDSID